MLISAKAFRDKAFRDKTKGTDLWDRLRWLHFNQPRIATKEDRTTSQTVKCLTNADIPSRFLTAFKLPEAASQEFANGKRAARMKPVSAWFL